MNVKDQHLINKWSVTAREALLYRTVKFARFMLPEEAKLMGWDYSNQYESCLVIGFTDDTIIYPSMDDEGNDAGFFDFYLPNNDSFNYNEQIKKLVGMSVLSAGYTPNIAKQRGWYNIPAYLVLGKKHDDSSEVYLIPQRDPEGNDGGAIFGQRGKIDIGLPVIGGLKMEKGGSPAQAMNSFLHFSQEARMKFGERGMFPKSGEAPSFQVITVSIMKEHGWKVTIWENKYIGAVKGDFVASIDYSMWKSYTAYKILQAFGKKEGVKYEDGGQVSDEIFTKSELEEKYPFRKGFWIGEAGKSDKQNKDKWIKYLIVHRMYGTYPDFLRKEEMVGLGVIPPTTPNKTNIYYKTPYKKFKEIEADKYKEVHGNFFEAGGTPSTRSENDNETSLPVTASVGSMAKGGTTGNIISTLRAREIANNWHGGQWSALYQFGSSGVYMVENHLRYLKETQENKETEYQLHPHPIAKKDEAELNSLIRYFTYKGEENGIKTAWDNHPQYGYKIPYLVFDDIDAPETKELVKKVTGLRMLLEKGGKAGGYKQVKFPEPESPIYNVVRETADEYVIVNEEKMDWWNEASQIERIEYYEDIVAKDEVEEVGGKPRGLVKGTKAKIKIKSYTGNEKYDQIWYLTNHGGDHTHVWVSNNPETEGSPAHVAEFRNQPFYKDLEAWLSGEMEIDGKEYTANVYAEGGPVEGYNKYIRSKDFDAFDKQVKTVYKKYLTHKDRHGQPDKYVRSKDFDAFENDLTKVYHNFLGHPSLAGNEAKNTFMENVSRFVSEPAKTYIMENVSRYVSFHKFAAGGKTKHHPDDEEAGPAGLGFNQYGEPYGFENNDKDFEEFEENEEVERITKKTGVDPTNKTFRAFRNEIKRDYDFEKGGEADHTPEKGEVYNLKGRAVIVKKIDGQTLWYSNAIWKRANDGYGIDVGKSYINSEYGVDINEFKKDAIYMKDSYTIIRWWSIDKWENEIDKKAKGGKAGKIEKGSIVKYSEPEAGEEKFRFVVLDAHYDVPQPRAHIELLDSGMSIAPVEVVRIADLQEVTPASIVHKTAKHLGLDKKAKVVVLNAEEDKAYSDGMEFYLNAGQSNATAEKHTIEELRETFPRLKKLLTGNYTISLDVKKESGGSISDYYKVVGDFYIDKKTFKVGGREGTKTYYTGKSLADAVKWAEADWKKNHEKAKGGSAWSHSGNNWNHSSGLRLIKQGSDQFMVVDKEGYDVVGQVLPKNQAKELVNNWDTVSLNYKRGAKVAGPRLKKVNM